MTRARNGTILLLARVAAVACAIAAAILTVYCGMLVYAGATFQGDSLPGPTVLYMVAVGVGLGAMLCAGLAHVLWRNGKAQP